MKMISPPKLMRSSTIGGVLPYSIVFAVMLAAIMAISPGLRAAAPKDQEIPSPGIGSDLSATLDDVLQALQDVLHDQIIHGTYVYEKDKTLTGATAVDSTPLFDPWHGEGKAFYKVRTAAIAPRHFRDSADRGTIAVRYIITSINPEKTRVHIDALFVEDTHHGSHPSDGTVESSELKEIQEHVQAIQAARQQAVEEQQRLASIDLANRTLARQREEETTRLASAESSARDLQQQVDTLRHQVEMRIKAPGGSLKSAPFQSAAEVAPLAAYTDVLLVIITPRWYGVETPNGQRGWVPLEQLEPLP
jgi:hypothetical protein